MCHEMSCFVMRPAGNVMFCHGPPHLLPARGLPDSHICLRWLRIAWPPSVAPAPELGSSLGSCGCLGRFGPPSAGCGGIGNRKWTPAFARVTKGARRLAWPGQPARRIQAKTKMCAYGRARGPGRAACCRAASGTTIGAYCFIGSPPPCPSRRRPACGGSLFRAYRARAGPSASARFAHLIARARRRTHVSRRFCGYFFGSGGSGPGRLFPQEQITTLFSVSRFNKEIFP